MNYKQIIEYKKFKQITQGSCRRAFKGQFAGYCFINILIQESER